MNNPASVRKFGCYISSIESTAENLRVVLDDLEGYFREHGEGEALFDIVSTIQQQVEHLEADLRSVRRELGGSEAGVLVAGGRGA